MLDAILEYETQLAFATSGRADRGVLGDDDLLGDRAFGIGSLVEEDALKHPLSARWDLVDEDDVAGNLVEEDAWAKLGADVPGVQDLALHEPRLVAGPRLNEGIDRDRGEKRQGPMDHHRAEQLPGPKSDRLERDDLAVRREPPDRDERSQERSDRDRENEQVGDPEGKDLQDEVETKVLLDRLAGDEEEVVHHQDDRPDGDPEEGRETELREEVKGESALAEHQPSSLAGGAGRPGFAMKVPDRAVRPMSDNAYYVN